MANEPNHTHNLLVAALPAAARRRLLADREPVELVLAETLIEPGEPVRHAFFPIDSFISLMVPLGLIEVVRTGVAAISRGPEGM